MTEQNRLSNDDVTAIKAMMEEWTSRLVEVDWDQWQTFWAEGGVLMPPGHAVITGREDLVTFAAENFGTAKSFTFSDWTIEGLADLAVVTNTIRIEFDGTTPEQPAAANHQMLLLRKLPEEGWRVHKVIYNPAGPEE